MLVYFDNVVVVEAAAHDGIPAACERGLSCWERERMLRVDEEGAEKRRWFRSGKVRCKKKKVRVKERENEE